MYIIRSLKGALLLVLAVAAIIVTAMVSTSHAQEWSGETVLRTNYVDQNGAKLAAKPVSQSEVCAAFSSGLYGCGWMSAGLGKEKGADAPDYVDYSNELDGIVGLANNYRWLNYDANFQYLAINGGDVVGTSFELGIKMVFAKIEGYSPVQKGGPAKGLLTSVGYKLDGLPLFERFERFQLSNGQWLKHDTGVFGYQKAWHYQGDLGVSIGLTDTLRMPVGVEWTIPLTDLTDGREAEASWKIGLTKSF